ncbi:MAG: aminoglycoside phosphotransferase family protein [Caulobacteraceae bacterium]
MTVDYELEDFLVDADLADWGEPQIWTPLTGGISSDIWRVDLPGRTICVKRAVETLRSQAEWHAPEDRNIYEWRWFKAVRLRFPDAAPEPLALDEHHRLLAMAFLPPKTHPLWKAELLAGRVDAGFAGQVGRRLGQIHAFTAADPDWAEEFPSGESFHALRIDAYLLAAARAQPAVAPALEALAARTEATRLALVHGDVSPKNILVGPKGPVFLDAETAWWGDPAFDVAFCLNHLLLKRLVVKGGAEALNASFSAFARAYLAEVDWEPPAALEARAASLLPGLMLARVDGKSPVEYVTTDAQRDLVRRTAFPLLLDPPAALEAVRAAWDRSLTQ